MAGIHLAEAYLWAATVGNPYVGILFAYLVSIIVLVTFVLRRSVRFDALQRGNRAHLALWRVATLVSFASTWFYMIRYLLWSYDAFLERVRLTGGLVTAMPECVIGGEQALACARLRATALLLRMGDWLRDTSLFKEAWLYVVANEQRWWWSAEVCAFTVAPWALFLYVEGKRRSIPHLWAYMLVGQMVAISVAQNLFHMALAARSLEVDRRSAGAEGSPSKASPRGKMVPARLLRTPSQLQMPPPESPSKASPPSTASSATTTLTTTLHTVTVEAHPSIVSRALVSALALAGCAAVWLVPDSLSTLLVMHSFPLLIVVLPPMLRQTAPSRWAMQATSPATLYSIFAIFALALRIKATMAVAGDLPSLLATFVSHPAQSSISSDAVCITLSSSLFILLTYGPSHRTMAIALAALAPLAGPTFAFSVCMSLQSRKDEAKDETLRHMAVLDQEKRGETSHLDDEFRVKQKITRMSHRNEPQTPEKGQAVAVTAAVEAEDAGLPSSPNSLASATGSATTSPRARGRGRGRGTRGRSARSSPRQA